MIRLTKLDGEALVVNVALIESIGATPETLISLSTGRKIWVRESCEEVVQLSLAYEALMRHEAMVPAESGGA